MRVVFFEDNQARDMSPIALMRPVFELLSGCWTMRERTLHQLQPDQWGVLIRPELAEVYRETPQPCGWRTAPPASVNEPAAFGAGSTLLVNGRWMPAADAFATCGPDNVGVLDGEVMWLRIDETEAALLDATDPAAAIAHIARDRTPEAAAGELVRYPWDLIRHNSDLLRRDLAELDCPSAAPGEAGVPGAGRPTILGPADDVLIDPTAEIDPFVLIDARGGPVHIAAEARIQAFTRIAGPCSIGHGSHVFRALIHAGTTIGPVCRVGGEIDASILHGYVNKSHEGFLGHSYVCPWVNLGAITTTSDLKNDYSSVRVPLNGEPVDSGETKIGCYIGDHTKTAIDSMFNTGSSIGVMSVVLPNGELLPKYVPSFGCIWHGCLQDSWELDRLLETARVAMERRGCELTEAQTRLLHHLHRRTANSRAAAVRRSVDRRADRHSSSSA